MLKKQIHTGSDMKNYSLVQCILNGINIMMTNSVAIKSKGQEIDNYH